ncbi:hypothetical protein LTS18_000532, partial [Coniosporium uncinatum]
NGHGCMLQYALLHLFGYGISMDDLKQFRQVDSITPGHPEAHDTPGIEVTTGPLGQGFANAVGLAVAQAHTAAVFNKPGYDLITNHTFCFFGDGCAMEGIASEAASAAGHLRLGNLIAIYDDNHISIGKMSFLRRNTVTNPPSRRRHQVRFYGRRGQAFRGIRLARSAR